MICALIVTSGVYNRPGSVESFDIWTAMFIPTTNRRRLASQGEPDKNRQKVNWHVSILGCDWLTSRM